MSADWWQNFANNFAADLAPLLSLFGEQPTKQYLSETLTFVDIVIFSIAPIGVLTAVVSATRVSEDPSLRAFIGRAQEGGAYAEAELCSSTSRDVCELYTTGGIARVFGRPKILEVIHDPPKGTDLDPDTAGIHTFEKYINLGKKPGWTENENRWRSENAAENSFSEHPNLSLNIGIKKRGRFWFYLAAALGLVLQGGVLIFASLATYVYPGVFKRDDTQIVVPAFPFTFVGTVLLCTGVGLCATVVERSTKERTFKRDKDSACRLHWIQPGGQVIGDQVFDSFAYSETSKHLLEQYTTSWKPNERTSGRNSEQATKKNFLVWAAIITTCVGFVFQFLGIRTLHSSVSVAQFVVMLVMSTVRALLRTQRLEKSDNQMGDSYTLYQGHELDWLSIKLACPENDDDGRRWIWQIVRPFEGFSYEAVDLSQNTPKSSPSTDSRRGIEKAFLKRARLARLTGAMSPNCTSIAYSSWDMTLIASRELASSLAKAIEGTMTLFYNEGKIESDWKGARKICWSMPCTKGTIEEDLGSQPDLIRFTLSRQFGNTEASWKADKSELEAALGLWLWSIRLKERVYPSGEPFSKEIPVKIYPCSRIILFGGNDIFRVEKLEPAATSLKLWLGSRRLILRQTAVTFRSNSFGPGDIAQPVENHKPQRLFGHHLLPKLAARETAIHVLEVPSESSFEMMCAQEIFSAFLTSLSPILRQLGGRTSITKSSDKLYLENQTLSNMIRNFAASGIDSKEDALTCIVPILYDQGKLIHSMVFTESIDAADAYRRRNDWMNAERILLSALSLSFQAPKSYAIPYTMEQNMCLLALCDLYRWALLGNRQTRLFGLRGLLSICKTHTSDCLSNEVLDYCDTAFALCHRYTDDPTIRNLSKEYQAEIKTDRTSPRSYETKRRNLIDLKDDYFPRALQQRDLCATLCLLKDQVISFCRDPPAIFLAAGNGWVTVLKNLLELGANPEEIDKDGRNYLHYSSQHRFKPETFLQIVGNQGYLLNGTDKHGMTPLHVAAEANCKEIAGILMDQFSLDPYQWDLHMRSAFECAFSQRHTHTLPFLVAKMVQSLHVSSSNVMWNTLMQIAILVSASGSKYYLDRFIKRLKDEGSDSANQDTENILNSLCVICETLFGKFAIKGCFEFGFLQSTFYDHFGPERVFSTNMALSCKATINDIPLTPFLENPEKITSLDDTGRSCLHYAIKGGNQSRIQELLNAHLNIGKRRPHHATKGVSPTGIVQQPNNGMAIGINGFHDANQHWNPTRIQEVNASVNIEDKTGKTPLEYAFGGGNLVLTSLLLEHGAGTHRLPLEGSAIVAQYSDTVRQYKATSQALETVRHRTFSSLTDTYRLYFQDTSLRIRELVMNIEGNEKVGLSLEIAVARESTPLVVIAQDNHNRKVHVFYVSEENYICDTINDGFEWLAGSLSHKRIKVHQPSALAALRTNVGVSRVFYQDVSGDLQEIRSVDGNKWESPKRIRKIPPATAFTVLTTPEGVTRIIFQGEKFPEEICENHTEWDDGTFFRKVGPLIEGEKYPSIRSIAVAARLSRTVFWLDKGSHMYETTLTDDGYWEDSMDVDGALWNGKSHRANSQLAIIGSEPKVLYQTQDGSFYELLKHESSWSHGKMVIPTYDR